nr:hypothetical protein [Tanacetum cinerariifolium]
MSHVSQKTKGQVKDTSPKPYLTGKGKVAEKPTVTEERKRKSSQLLCLVQDIALRELEGPAQQVILQNAPLAKRKRGPSAVELDNITKSNKTLKLRSAATTEGAEKIPPGLYLDIQKALALTNHLKNKYHRPSIAELCETEIRIRSRVEYFKKAKMLPRTTTVTIFPSDKFGKSRATCHWG